MNRSVLARQMFAKGGQAVPNEYKGFSRLPEAVQMRMDPAAAKKYENGGSVNYEDPVMRRALELEVAQKYSMTVPEFNQMMSDPQYAAEAADMGMGPAEYREFQVQKMIGQGTIDMRRSDPEYMDAMRQQDNRDALEVIRNRARAQAMGANQYGVPVLGLDDVSRTDASKAEDFDPNNIYNIARFFRSNPGAKVSDYNRYFRTNLNPEEFEIFETEAEPVGMAMGGDPAMAQGVGGMMPPDMPPPPAMPEGQGMAEQVMDPQVLEGVLSEAQNQITDLDEAEDYETVINSIRGEEAPIEERYEELASIVGEEDARQTPESVLTLVQPAMVMGAVDQGIGGLAAEEMSQPVQGAMAQGIMSTVEPPQPAMEAGGTPPVNFKDGGLVRRGDNQPVQIYANGGEATPLQTAYEGRLPLYESILGDPTAQLEEQKKLTQAQMLFDIAGTALAFAGPMQGERPGMSAAERLAMAATQTKLLPTIGARAQQQLDAKKAATAAEQKMKLGALGAAEADVTAQAKAAAAERKAALEAGYRINEIMLKQTGEMELAQSQANWKASLQDDQQLAAEAIKRLEGDQSKEAIRLRKKLEKQNAISLQLLKGEQAIEEIGLRSMSEIASSDKKHVQALQIQENNQALSREQKRIDVGLKTIDQQIAMDAQELEKAAMLQRANAETRKAKLDQERLALEKQGLQNTAQYRANQLAIAYADQDLKEAKMLQDADAATQQQILKQKELELKERKILIGEAAAGLSKFGSGTQARITTFLSDPDRIKAYKDGTMDKDETLEMNTILTLYANPIDVWNEEKQDWVTQKATPLSNEMMDALRARKEKDLTMPAGITIPGLTEEEDGVKKETGPAGNDIGETTFGSLIEDLDSAKGTGAPAAAAKAINTAFKAVLPFLNKPFSEGSRAARLINNINTQATIVYMTDVSGKVNLQMQERILETLPKPEQWFSTDQDAINAIENTIAAFNSRLQAIDVQLKPADKGGVGGLSAEQKSRLSSQRESLKVIRDAYTALGKDYIGSGGSKKKDKRPIEEFIGG